MQKRRHTNSWRTTSTAEDLRRAEALIASRKAS
jgi:hypothetical protein